MAATMTSPFAPVGLSGWTPGMGFTGTTMPRDLREVDECATLSEIYRHYRILTEAARAKVLAPPLYLSLPYRGTADTIPSYSETTDIRAGSPASNSIFDAIQALYLSNTLRNRQIAERLTSLNRDAIAEDEYIRPESLDQFRGFFLEHPDLGLPKITLTPDGTLRARWIREPNDFIAIEFIGGTLTKVVAEIPGEIGDTARYFGSESIQDVVSAARAKGATFA